MTVRHINGNNPLRIILDDKKTLNKNFNVFNNESMTIVISDFSSKNNIGKYLCEILYKNKVQSIIIEGGKKTLEIFIKNNIWDEARIFKNELNLNDGVLSPKINGVDKSKYKIGKDELRVIYPN